MVSPDLTTIREALRWAGKQLADIADRPHAEAERLLASVLEVERTTLLTHPEWDLQAMQVRRFAEIVNQRSQGTPLPYILGHVEFFGLELAVTSDVLIPRPETELLVEMALNRMLAHPHGRVVDVGTGSGCIAVALARAAPDAHIYATDISTQALAVARRNGLSHSVGKRITWVQADLLSPFAAPIDLIVSNPPYVAGSEWQDLPYSVRQEPRLALLAGADGLDVIRRLLRQAERCLATDGCLLTEIGESQASAVLALARVAFAGPRFRAADVQIHRDLAGKDRLLEVTLAGPVDGLDPEWRDRISRAG